MLLGAYPGGLCCSLIEERLPVRCPGRPRPAQIRFIVHAVHIHVDALDIPVFSEIDLDVTVWIVCIPAAVIRG